MMFLQHYTFPLIANRHHSTPDPPEPFINLSLALVCHFIPLPCLLLQAALVTLCYRLLQCYPARYFRNLEGLEGSETKGFWTAASAHVLPSIVVQVFKVLTSSEKYVKIPENYLRRVRCLQRDSACFWAVSGHRNLPRRLPEWTKSVPMSRVERVLGKYL